MGRPLLSVTKNTVSGNTTPRIASVRIMLPHILYDSICFLCVKSAQSLRCCQAHSARSFGLAHGGETREEMTRQFSESLLLKAAVLLTPCPAALLGSPKDRL